MNDSNKNSKDNADSHGNKSDELGNGGAGNVRNNGGNSGASNQGGSGSNGGQNDEGNIAGDSAQDGADANDAGHIPPNFMLVPALAPGKTAYNNYSLPLNNNGSDAPFIVPPAPSVDNLLNDGGGTADGSAQDEAEVNNAGQIIPSVAKLQTCRRCWLNCSYFCYYSAFES